MQLCRASLQAQDNALRRAELDHVTGLDHY